MKKKCLLIALFGVVGIIALSALVEWVLKQPIRRNFEYYSEYTIDVLDDGIYIRAIKAEVSKTVGREAIDPLWFDDEKEIVHLRRIIYCETSPWEAMFGSGVADDANWLTMPLNQEGRSKGEARFPRSGRFYDGEYCDYVYDEIWYEDRDGTLHLVWSVNDMNEKDEQP
jgi:hypothetical protein